MIQRELKEAITSLKEGRKLSSHRMSQVLRILMWADDNWDTFDRTLYLWTSENESQ
jgi:hypothetical protein